MSVVILVLVSLFSLVALVLSIVAITKEVKSENHIVPTHAKSDEEMVPYNPNYESNIMAFVALESGAMYRKTTHDPEFISISFGFVAVVDIAPTTTPESRQFTVTMDLPNDLYDSFKALEHHLFFQTSAYSLNSDMEGNIYTCIEGKYESPKTVSFTYAVLASEMINLEVDDKVKGEGNFIIQRY